MREAYDFQETMRPTTTPAPCTHRVYLGAGAEGVIGLMVLCSHLGRVLLVRFTLDSELLHRSAQ